MHIEINAGGLGTGLAVGEFQLNMAGFISDAESMISCFKTVQNDALSLSGGVGNLQGAVDEISQRIRQEEDKLDSAVTVQNKANDFLELAVRVDQQVASQVRKNKNQFYQKYPHLEPVDSTEEENWGEKAWAWICGAGAYLGEKLEEGWTWVKDTAKKAWDGLVDFYNEHWYDIVNWGVTILCAVGSILAIALIPVTGGASILLVAGVSALSSAIVAATRSITTQQRDKGTVDWKEVGKEAATAAVVGAITGAIGAGVGGAITSGLSNTALGASLLGSSSTVVRVLTGAAIGSASEVASGMLARGAAEATESYLETGTVDLGDVWDAASDPQQMVQDAVIGGATGGFAGKNAPEPEPTKFSSVHDDGFPDESVQAVTDYVGPNHYSDINQSYIDPSIKLSPENQKIDFELTHVLEQSEIPEAITTYRGGTLDELGDLGDIALKFQNDPGGLQQALEGKSYIKKGYMSTGDQALANSYAQDFHVTIDVPAGSSGLDVSISPTGKSEYLFPANSKLDIVSAEWNNGKLYVNAKLDQMPAGNAFNGDIVRTQPSAGQGIEIKPWQQSETKVEAFLGKDYHSQISINSSDLTAGKHGGSGTIRVDSLRGEIAGKPQDLTNLKNYSAMEHFEVAEVKNYKIETSYGRTSLKNNIIEQANQRNQVLSQNNATVNQTYYVDTTGHPVTIGQWEKLYDRLEKALPKNVDIFPLWK